MTISTYAEYKYIKQLIQEYEKQNRIEQHIIVSYSTEFGISVTEISLDELPDFCKRFKIIALKYAS